jgi:hypothetical protein
LPNLAGKKITLSFAPATQADENLMTSYLPAPHADGTPVQLSEFPKGLPGYLINLTSELRVDGQIVATGGVFTMGTSMVSSTGLFDPNTGWNFGEDNQPIAGEYIATHVDEQGISTDRLQALMSKLAATKATLDANSLLGITKEELAGDILYSAVLLYFTANQAENDLTSRSLGAVDFRTPSFGNFQTVAQPTYWFGVPRQVYFPGVAMDVDRYVTMAVMKDNSASALLNYRQQVGMRLSASEHSIPEQIFTDLADPNRPQAVSAAKALSYAAAQGQQIHTITAANAATMLPQLAIAPDVSQEIADAVSAGKIAVVSHSNVSVTGWSGIGYIISDPDTGAGAYKISGGFSGGDLPWNDIGAAFGAMLDGLLKHYRDPNSMFGPDSEILFAKFGAIAGKILALATLVKDIVVTLRDDKTNTAQKITKILGALASGIAGALLGPAIAGLFFNPVGAVIVAMIAVVLVTILIDFITDWIVGLLAMHWPFRRRSLYASYA